MAIGWKDRSMEKEFTVLEPKNSLDSGKRVSLKRNLSDNFFMSLIYLIYAKLYEQQVKTKLKH